MWPPFRNVGVPYWGAAGHVGKALLQAQEARSGSAVCPWMGASAPLGLPRSSRNGF